jgi:YidC/Oxa1 family membrane protein insertase
MLKILLLYPLFNLLILIYAVLPVKDLGVAIIILTIIIRLLIGPLVKRQLHHQKAMNDLKPELKKVKEKAKGDKQKESQLMVELFKEKKINPFSSIGLTLLQFPILLTLFFVLNRVLDPSNYSTISYEFVRNLDAIQAIITDPSHFNPTFLGLVHMSEPSLVLAALAGLGQFIQTKQLMPQNTFGAKPGAKAGFNMTLIFPIVTVVIAARLPAALALYWFVSSAVALIQQQSVLKQEITVLRRLRLGKRKQDGKSS